MMGSALAFPARENGNEVRLVGTHLDREIIDGCLAANRHLKFSKDFPAGISFYQIEQLHTAIAGADFIICGVSSFGVEWFRDVILPQLHENVPVISVTKGLMNTEDGTLLTYLDVWQQKLDAHPLLAHYDKLQRTLLQQFEALGLNYKATPSKIKENTKKGGEAQDKLSSLLGDISEIN